MVEKHSDTVVRSRQAPGHGPVEKANRRVADAEGESANGTQCNDGGGVKPSAHVERLAAQIRSLRDEPRPRTLPILLGDACGERAGVPTPAAMGRAAMQSLFTQTPEFAKNLLPDGPQASDEAVAAAFLRWLGGMTHLQRYRVLEPFYRRVPVPIFYQDLADLVLAGFVTHILTTNVDSLLEQALEAVGLAAGRDFGVIVLGLPERKADTPDLPPTTIMKLKGDLGQTQLPVTPDEIEQLLAANRSLLRSELASDMIVVGYEVAATAGGEVRGLDHWLARGDGEMWWVHPEQPPRDVIAPIAAHRPITYLSGEEDGDPENFFGQLSLHLIQLPALDALGSGSGVDSLEEQFLRSRIDKAQVTKLAFEQSTAPGDDNTGIEAQIDYQADKVADYRRQLRERAPLDVQTIVSRVVSEAQQAGADPATLDFLNQQSQLVTREFASPSPNQRLVSAGLTAMSSVVDGLDPGVSRDLRTELRKVAAGYAPGPSGELTVS
jgi:phosphoglycolate phosphatase-like HAD superfamily hydrolase